MRQSEVIKYYSCPEIAREIARAAAGREAIARLGSGGFGRRPDIIEMPGDVIRLARLGATSFHASEEIWSDPLKLSSEITAHEMDSLREGWDLVIDIDSPNVKYGKIVAKLILQAFEYHGLRNASLKYSGNKGFHIGVPFKALPKSVRGEAIEKLFPDAPRVVALYLKEFIRSSLAEAVLNRIGSIKQIVEDTGIPRAELLVVGKGGWEFDPYRIIELDTILIAPRHLCRMAYSLHEKSGLASVVLSPEELDAFEMEMAKPERLEAALRERTRSQGEPGCGDVVRDWFLNAGRVEAGEASQFIVQAFDWHKEKDKSEDGEAQHIEFEGEIGAENFPPCVKLLLQGVEEGRKRGLFILANFFKCMNWSWDKIAFQLVEWNKKNKPPLKTGYVKSQLAWHQMHGKKVPPPNCDNAGYYKDMGVCRPVESCKGCKNPLTFVARKVKKTGKSKRSKPKH